MALAVQRLTWEDIKDSPESAGRTELVDGELIVSPTPASRHQRICTRLGVLLAQHIWERKLGEIFVSPVHVILDVHTHYEPDLCFIAESRRAIVKENFIEGPPDLIVEVISESNRTHDTVVKHRDYERYGVREYWLVDPRENHVRVFVVQDGAYETRGVFGPGDTITSEELRDLRLDPADILAMNG